MNRMLLLRAWLPGQEAPEKSEEPGTHPSKPAVPVLEAEWGRRLVEELGTLEKRLAGLGEGEPAGEPGTVRVRVVGKGPSDEVLPLPGLAVRWVQREQRVEARTEVSGVAVLRPPVSEGAYRVRVWAGKERVGEVRGTLRPGEAPLHELEVDARAELVPYLERAHRWAQSLARAREKVESLRRQTEAALAPPPA